jgi:hypothetical protein
MSEPGAQSLPVVWPRPASCRRCRHVALSRQVVPALRGYLIGVPSEDGERAADPHNSDVAPCDFRKAEERRSKANMRRNNLDERARSWVVDYSEARRRALERLGERYLLAKPINARTATWRRVPSGERRAGE